MDDKVTPNGTKDANLSTEHQREGDARLPSDTLDRGQATTEGENAPKRKSSFLHNK
jgi:hypothetical protein